MHKEAWKILTEEEKTAISLAFSHGKSTWEAGEIMNRAHYKYLEIKQRAERFLKMFTEYLAKHTDIIPTGVHIPIHLREFINLSMVQRRLMKDIVDLIDDDRYKVTSVRNRLIIQEMENLKELRTEQALDLYELIVEFDRWNNFRILPPTIQEPSAFKRRNKSRNLKHLKHITQLPEFTIYQVIKRFEYVGKYSKLYLPLITPYYDNVYKVIGVKNKAKNITNLTTLGLFIFENKDHAEEFAELVSDFISKDKKRCIDGQKFWPQFRVLIEKTLNSKALNNIIPNRRNMENAYKNLDIHVVSKMKAKSKLSGGAEDRIDGDKLW